MILALTLLLSVSKGTRADDCINFANSSIQQQDKNLFNLCGFRGSQWTSNFKALVTECRVMSSRDRKKRLEMRDKLLKSCPIAADPSHELTNFGRNRQQKLLSVLLSAIHLENENLVRSVLNAGVNLGEQPEWMAASPLFLSIELGNYHIARILLRAGAKPYLLASGEINPISLLLQDGPTNHAFLELLLQNNANPNLKGKNVEAQLPIVFAAAKGDFRSLDLLLKYKADPNLFGGMSALQKAVRADHYPMVRALIKGGANPNLGVDRQLCDGMLALDIAYRQASERVIDLLLDNRGLTELECKQLLEKRRKSRPKSRNR
jgi:ankyrin repeat protein